MITTQHLKEYDDTQDHIEGGSFAYAMTLPAHPQPQQFESFTSYRVRLAEANHIESIREFAKLLFPDTDPRIVRDFSNHPPQSYGNLPLATNCGEERIRSTTYAPISDAFGRSAIFQSLKPFLKGSVTNDLRYCPYCIDENPWYLLQWQFISLRGCPTHGCYLVDKCVSCQTPINPWKRPFKIGVCQSCNKLLHEAEPNRLTIDDQEFTIFFWEELNNLISWPHNLPKYAQKSFNLCTNLKDIRMSKGLTGENVAKKIGVDFRKISAIDRNADGISYFKLNEYFSYLKGLDISIRELIDISQKSIAHFQEKERNGDNYTIRIGSNIPRNISFDHNEIAILELCNKSIENLQERDINVSFSSISALTSIGVETLKAYPAVHNLINTLRTLPKTNRNRPSKNIDVHIENLVNIIQIGMRDLKKENIKPNFGSLCAISGISEMTVIKYEKVYAVAIQLLVEHQRTEIDSRLTACKELINTTSTSASRSLDQSNNISLSESLHQAATKYMNVDELEKSYRLSADPDSVRRWAALWLMGLGLSIQQTVYILECSNRFITDLCRNYEREGPDYLKRNRKSGGFHRRLLSEEQAETLRMLLTKPTDDGQPWTTILVADWIRTHMKVDVTLGTVRALLLQLSPTPLYPIPHQVRQREDNQH